MKSRAKAIPGSKRFMCPTCSTSPLARTASRSALALLDADAERLLDEHVLARLERLRARPATWNWSAIATITASTLGSASIAS